MGKFIEKEHLYKGKLYLGKPAGFIRFALKLVLIEIVMAPLLGCDPLNTQFEDSESAIMYESFEPLPEKSSPRDLRIMTWNIKFAGGRIDFFFDCHGERVHMTESEVRQNLDGVAEKIRSYDPDILLLQEVDVDSKRCAHVDMVQYLLDHTNLNFGSYASQWKADYVPSYGLGQVDTGSAILSKWKFKNAERESLPLIEEQDSLTQYFWLKRNLLVSEVFTPNGILSVVNVHTSAFSKDGTKKKQIDRFKARLDEIAASGKTFIAGGDLNTLPPGAEKTSEFEDSVCPRGEFDADDYSKESSWLGELYDDYNPVIPLDLFHSDNKKYSSHTTDKKGFWNRKLDYIFTNAEFSEGMVHQDESTGGVETMKLSDHAPMTATLRWTK